MWVPWKPGNPGQQGRPQGGRMSHSQAMAEARAAHRKKEFRALKSGKISQGEYNKRIAAIERKYR